MDKEHCENCVNEVDFLDQIKQVIDQYKTKLSPEQVGRLLIEVSVLFVLCHTNEVLFGASEISRLVGMAIKDNMQHFVGGDNE